MAAPTYADLENETRLGGFLKRRLQTHSKQTEEIDNPIKIQEVLGGSNQGLYVRGKGTLLQHSINDREILIYLPPTLKKKGDIPLLIVLHGGFGQATQIQNYLGIDPLADQGKFIVTYVDGTKVSRRLPDKFKGWNADGCCGEPMRAKIDDVTHIKKIITYLTEMYGIDPNQVYGTGHSNGAMMTQRMMYETNLYQSAVSISGTLQMEDHSYSYAKGKHLLNIHGTMDDNVPIEGGHTKAGINKQTAYKSQSYSKDLFERSGGQYDLLLLKGADHKPETINAKLIETEHLTLPQKIISYLGLLTF